MVETWPGSKNVGLVGSVTNTPNPGGMGVLFSGQVVGSTTTDANGNFNVTLPASDLGAVYAATGDGQSNIARGAVVDPGTTIVSMMGSQYPGNVWLFSGQVQGGYQGEVVHLSGVKDLEGKSTTLDWSGRFSYVQPMDNTMDDVGDAYFQATDAWGLNSNEASWWVM